MLHLAVNKLDELSQQFAVWLGKKRLDRQYAKISESHRSARHQPTLAKQLLLGKGWDNDNSQENLWIFSIKRSVEICDHFQIPVEKSKIVRMLAEIHHGCGNLEQLEFCRNRLVGCFSPTFALFQAMIYVGDINKHEARTMLRIHNEATTLSVLNLSSPIRLNQLLDIKE